MSKHTNTKPMPAVLILNQMAGPMTWELAEDMGDALGCVALLTGHPDTLQKSHDKVLLYPAAAYQRGSFAHRALSWLHYIVQAWIWLWRWPADVPILLFSNPPILCWLGWLIRFLRGTRYSVMVHDIYPDMLVRMTDYREHHPLIWLWRWLNRRAYEQADTVMTLGELMAGSLENQFSSDKTATGTVKIVYPWVDTERIKPIPKEENWFARKYSQVDKVTVMYSGNMGLGHDIETMLEAARLLKDYPQIHFMFIGSGPKWVFLDEMLRLEPLSNVTLLDWQSEETFIYSLATADLALVSIEPEVRALAIPSKTIYSLSVASAVLALVDKQTEVYQWTCKHQFGVPICPKASEELARIIMELSVNQERLRDVRCNARKASVGVFDRSKNTAKIVSSFQS